MEDGLPPVITFGGEIERDVVLRLSFLIEAGDFDWLAFEDRRHLADALRIPEGEDLHRAGSLYFATQYQRAKDLAHLLEAQRDIAPPLFTVISDNGEVRRLDFSPLLRGKSQKRKQQHHEDPETHRFEIVLWTVLQSGRWCPL